MANPGITSLPKTWPILRPSSWLVMTEPAFISEPVPLMVRTSPTGMTLPVGCSMLRYRCSQGSPSVQADTDTPLA